MLSNEALKLKRRHQRFETIGKPLQPWISLRCPRLPSACSTASSSSAMIGGVRFTVIRDQTSLCWSQRHPEALLRVIFAINHGRQIYFVILRQNVPVILDARLIKETESSNRDK
jgi:hypothetical protein